MERETAIQKVLNYLRTAQLTKAVTLVAARQPGNYTLHLFYNALILPTDLNKNWFTGLAVMLTHQRHLGIYILQKARQLAGLPPLKTEEMKNLVIIIQTGAKLTKADAGKN